VNVSCLYKQKILVVICLCFNKIL